jgi:adenine deaminase
MGIEGVIFMIQNGSTVPFRFYFGAPSCVPATSFETAGASISPDEVEVLLCKPEVKYLAEMMNWPGVLYDDELVYQKLEIARKYGKVVDGHAPGVRGTQAKKYFEAGITTDHECFTADEALDKLALGVKVLIREGSAAKNFEALIGLLTTYEDQIMFCSDDMHPDRLVEGHINVLVQRALNKGIDLFKVLKAACINPLKHYGLEIGQLKVNDPADFIVIDHPQTFNILKTFIQGQPVAEYGRTNIPSVNVEMINKFNTSFKKPEDFALHGRTSAVKVIQAMDGQLVTGCIEEVLSAEDGCLKGSVEKDILKITVVNRYKEARPAVAFIRGFGLREGALASSVAHDSHNIIAVGTDDQVLSDAVNEIIKNKGGISAVHSQGVHSLPLPVAGLMSAEDGYLVAEKYASMDRLSKSMGSTLSSPFMTLSFMALLVIPSLKLSDLGLFDGDKFEFVQPPLS